MMRTVHTSMTSTFYSEFIASFECKALTLLTLKCNSHGYVYIVRINLEKLTYRQNNECCNADF